MTAGPPQLRTVILWGILIILLPMVPMAGAVENVGLVVGIDHSSLKGDEPAGFNFQPETGFLISAQVEFSLTDGVALRLQPGYLSTGTALAYQDRAAGVERDSLSLELEWLTLPILLRVNSETGMLYACGGVELAWAMAGGLIGGEVEIPAEDLIRNLDVAAVASVGLAIPVGRYQLNTELRYRQGLVNAALNDTPSAGTMPRRFRLAGFQFQVGFVLPLGGRK